MRKKIANISAVVIAGIALTPCVLALAYAVCAACGAVTPYIEAGIWTLWHLVMGV